MYVDVDGGYLGGIADLRMSYGARMDAEKRQKRGLFGEGGRQSAFGDRSSLSSSKMNTITNESARLVRQTPVELSSKAKVTVGERFRKSTVNTVLELRGRTLVSGSGLLLNIDDAVVEKGKKAGELKVRLVAAEQTYRLLFDSVNEASIWLEKLSASGDKVGLSDFEVIKPIGKGGMGAVFLVRHKETGERLAMKVLKRYTIEDSGKSMRRALDERLVLEMAAGHPFIVELKYAFQTEKNLYMVTEFCAGGDLHDYLQAHQFHIKEDVAKHFFTEVVLAIEFIHDLGAVYRDVKPENVLVDISGHVKLADLGLTKLLEAGRMGRSHSFCGTKNFMAPEVFLRRGHGVAADLWSLGVLLYTLLTGSTPVGDLTNFDADDLTFPEHISSNVQDVIIKLLQPENERLTIAQLKAHQWFNDIDWNVVMKSSHQPVDGLWAEWEKTMLASGKSLHTKSQRILDLTIGDDSDIELSHSLQKKSQPYRRLLRRGSKVNLIPGYMFTSSISRTSVSATVSSMSD
eukprot:Plantae.Rhodophyta-Purpureofilum_apyrenoidigerum.ctg10717.p1 GENE.Plantae.Rhodophyta-Purpureofilum_apyrenoidigerum.ctg10717~~Plantae.Rhodophyta-Purpureofilum_apyrenoidigerum.ctg10717.p1  ORF type:complete len:526 (-),score=107.24 Plantae.Rhodophyta-Purpureofilum_apyrenoidigerum.ctg10717:1135-2682(-)